MSDTTLNFVVVASNRTISEYAQTILGGGGISSHFLTSTQIKDIQSWNQKYEIIGQGIGTPSPSVD